MAAHALVDLECPHCAAGFSENAGLVRPGGNAWCPHCGKLFALDANQNAVLEAAFAARRRRKERRAELRARWSDVPRQAPAEPPMRMSDVLRTLDDLLDRLDGLHRRS